MSLVFRLAALQLLQKVPKQFDKLTPNIWLDSGKCHSESGKSAQTSLPDDRNSCQATRVQYMAFIPMNTRSQTETLDSKQVITFWEPSCLKVVHAIWEYQITHNVNLFR